MYKRNVHNYILITSSLGHNNKLSQVLSFTVYFIVCSKRKKKSTRSEPRINSLRFKVYTKDQYVKDNYRCNRRD